MAVLEAEERTYSRVGGWLCLDFTNTMHSYTLVQPDTDYFQSYADLTTWARQAELITRNEEEELNSQAQQMPEKAINLLERARSLRIIINRVFASVAAEHKPDPEALAALNSELADAESHSCIEETDDGYRWGWSGFPNQMESLLWPIVRSAADLLVNHEKLDLVRECAGDTCGWLFVDTSKNHSRRWCDMRDCGNSAKAKRFYQRKTQTQ